MHYAPQTKYGAYRAKVGNCSKILEAGTTTIYKTEKETQTLRVLYKP